MIIFRKWSGVGGAAYQAEWGWFGVVKAMTWHTQIRRSSIDKDGCEFGVGTYSERCR